MVILGMSNLFYFPRGPRAFLVLREHIVITLEQSRSSKVTFMSQLRLGSSRNQLRCQSVMMPLLIPYLLLHVVQDMLPLNQNLVHPPNGASCYE